MTRMFHYPPRTIAANYLRSAIGLVVTLGPLLLLEPAGWLGAVLLVGAALFLVYAVRAIVRHSTRIELDETGIEARALIARAVRWHELQAVRLNYYTTRMDGSRGWMELTVRGERGVVRLESDLEGFEAIASSVAREALKRNLPLDQRSIVHFAALGIEPGGLVKQESTLVGEAHHA